MHRAVHGVLTYVLLWLSFVYTDSVPTFTTSFAYSVMGRIASEHQWGMFTCALGTLGVVTYFVSNWRLRVIAAGCLAFGHAIISIMLFLGNPSGTGSGVYFGYAALGVLLAYSTANLGQRVGPYLESNDI